MLKYLTEKRFHWIDVFGAGMGASTLATGHFAGAFGIWIVTAILSLVAEGLVKRGWP